MNRDTHMFGPLVLILNRPNQPAGSVYERPLLERGKRSRSKNTDDCEQLLFRPECTTAFLSCGALNIRGLAFEQDLGNSQAIP
jgi:hypothetical protein